MSNNSLFDVIGPIMVGPSSSHTAGAAKLGRLARQLVHGDIVEVRFTFYDSFARTYRGHGTGKALLGGVMGYDLDSEELKHAETIATFRGLKFSFEEGHKDGIHPNSVDIHLTEDNGKKTSLSGSSIGGGNVVITSINGIETRLQTNLPAIVTHHRDRVGILAEITKFLAEKKLNIAGMNLYRSAVGKDAYMLVEIDQTFDDAISQELRDLIDDIMDVFVIENR